MKKNKKTKDVIDVAQLKLKVVERFFEETGLENASTNHSEVTENGKVKIVIVRDSEKTFWRIINCWIAGIY